MFKIVLMMAMVLSLAMPVMAEGISDIFDDLAIREGVGIDFSDGETLVNIATADLILWGLEKDNPIAALGAGIATDFDDVTYPIATLSYIIGGLEGLGFSYPYDQYFVEPQVGCFLGRDIDTESEWHYGAQASIRIKF